MDNERELRAELMTALSPAFECWEHVPVRHVIFENKVLTADVIAVPRDDAFGRLTLAFEVKDPVARNGAKGVYDVPYCTLLDPWNSPSIGLRICNSGAYAGASLS